MICQCKNFPSIGEKRPMMQSYPQKTHLSDIQKSMLLIMYVHSRNPSHDKKPPFIPAQLLAYATISRERTPALINSGFKTIW